MQVLHFCVLILESEGCSLRPEGVVLALIVVGGTKGCFLDYAMQLRICMILESKRAQGCILSMARAQGNSKSHG